MNSIAHHRHRRVAAAAGAAILCGSLAFTVANDLTAAPDEPDFEQIFDGENFEGWEQNGNWKIEDGAMIRTEGGGGITFKAAKVPDDFELRFDWKISPGGNSGVYYRPGQYEYQILDNEKHSDGMDPRTAAGSLYYCIAPSEDATNPAGEWNTGRIVARGTKIEHWVNGKKVVDFDYTDPKHADAIERLRKRGANVEDRGAFLHLQDHGNTVWFRNIRIRDIES